MIDFDSIENEYLKDLEIDKFALDLECIEQPRRFDKYARLHAEAIAIRDQTKRKAQVTRSQIDKAVRNDPESYGIFKTTEAAISGVVNTDDAVLNDEAEVIEAARLVNLFQVAKEAFLDRKKELENLVTLYSQGYWSQPKTSTADISSRSTRDRQKGLKRRAT